MTQESVSLFNSEIFLYSDSEFSSFGSSESERDCEQIELDNIKLESYQFFKCKTPKISHQVLSTNNNKIENDFSSANQQSETQKNKNLIELKQFGNKLHQQIENNLSELRKSQIQLNEMKKSNKDLINDMKKQPNNLYQQIEIANNQLNSVKKLLLEFDLDERKIGKNDNSYEKILGKVKEISESIENSITIFVEDKNCITKKDPESFEHLCNHVEDVISEMDDIGKKLNELLDI